MGGEKKTYRGKSWGPRGSPPRGRGKDHQARAAEGGVWITPAWAGKSRPGVVIACDFRDHPRVGGEKVHEISGFHIIQGSPPRGRGKDLLLLDRKSGNGITPAWAGKRAKSKNGKKVKRDHPRVGGEKAGRWAAPTRCQGSPPRGRGKGSSSLKYCSFVRITPAWAGKRLKRFHRSGIFISGPIPFHSVLHRPAGSGGSRAGRDGSPAGQPQNAGPA